VFPEIGFRIITEPEAHLRTHLPLSSNGYYEPPASHVRMITQGLSPDSLPMVAAISRRHVAIRLDSASRAFVALRLAFLLRGLQRGFLRLLFRVSGLRHGIPFVVVGPKRRNTAPGRTGLSNRIAREEIAAKLRVERDHVVLPRAARTNSPPVKARSRFAPTRRREATSRGASDLGR
jgi:hypothetical protein